MLKTKLMVTFNNFRIREIFARDSRELGAKTEKMGVIELAPEVRFGCLEEEKTGQFHVLVIVRLQASSQKHKTSAKSLPSIVATIEGEATFNVSGISVREFRKTFNDMNFLDRLADQVYPLVNTRLAHLLSEMGIRTNFPLSLPEVESRVKLNNSNKSAGPVPVEEKILTKKPRAARVPK